MPFYLSLWFIGICLLLGFFTSGISFLIGTYLFYKRKKYEKKELSDSDIFTLTIQTNENAMKQRFEKLEEAHRNNSFDSKKINKTKLYEDKLSIAEILFLDYINGSNLSDDSFPKYWTYEYNINFQQSIEKFFSLDYIQESNYVENMKSSTLKTLKEILKKNELPISGKKEELVKRLLGNVDQDELRSFFDETKIVLTEKGISIIDKNRIFITNRKKYGFAIEAVKQKLEELEARNMGFSDRDIFWSLYNEKQMIEASQKEWVNFAFTHYHMSLFLKEEERFKAALYQLSSSLYIQLSGMSHQNRVDQIRSLLIGPALINDLNDLLQKLSMDTDEYLAFFRNQKFIKLPFQYFTQENMAYIIRDLLKGEKIEEAIQRYPTNKPQENSKNYDYYDLSKLK